MHCFASENQTYTGTWLFGFIGPRKPTTEKSTVKHPRRKRQIFVIENIFCKKVRYSKHKRDGFQDDGTFTRVFDFPPSDLMRPRIIVQRMQACACKMPSCSIRTSNLKSRHIQASKKDAFLFDFFLYSHSGFSRNKILLDVLWQSLG